MEQVNSAGEKNVHWTEAEGLVKKRWDMFSYLFYDKTAEKILGEMNNHIKGSGCYVCPVNSISLAGAEPPAAREFQGSLHIETGMCATSSREKNAETA